MTGQCRERVFRPAWAFMAMALAVIPIPVGAQSVGWRYTWTDGSQATGSWAAVKAFSEGKVAEYYLPMGIVSSCVWATPEPVPQHTMTGNWGGTFSYTSGTGVYPCSGSFSVTWTGCGPQEKWVNEINACVPFAVPDGPPKSPPNCSANPGFSKPIYPTTGTEKYILELDGRVGGQRLSTTYDTIRRAPVATSGTELADVELASFGSLWMSGLHKKLEIGGGSRGARVSRGGGRSVSFVGDGSGVFAADADTNDRLSSVGTGYRYIDASERTEESYNAQGQLTRIDRADGTALSYTYSTTSTSTTIAPGAGYLLSVADQFNRSIAFEYNAAGLVSKITGPAGAVVTPSYDVAGNLSQVTWPDSQVRRFLYENANFPWALTGITDENNARHATIGYDAQGRATSSELAAGVNRYSTSYGQAPMVVVTDTYDANAHVVFRSRTWQAPTAPMVTTPNGSTLDLGIGTVASAPGVISRSQPAGAGCAASSSAMSYDTNGNLEMEDDFNGKRVCRAYDQSRNLETTRVEGLASTQACAGVLPGGSALPSGSRKVSTQWHPDWRLPAKVAEPGRITTYVYNGQPDPLNGGAVASCAPASASLPDGKPIAVLCKRAEQATNDSDGHSGIGAPTAAEDASFANVSLLLHMDGTPGSQTFADASSSPKAVSAFGNAAISSIGKFGTGAAFDGAGDYLTVPHSAAIDLASGDFTVEAWVRLSVVGGSPIIINKANATGYYPYQLRYTSGKFLAIGFDSGTGIAYNMLGTTVAAAGTWYHLALTRSGSTFQLFVNGVQEASATFTGSLRSNASELVSIGAYSNGSYGFNGQIDEVRITKGVARYTSSFTLPTAPFAGVNVPIDYTIPPRVESWTYNQWGQVLTHDGPRTDVSDVSTYAYYSDTSFTGTDPNAVGHTTGDLQSVTNAKNQVTSYTKYNKHGQLLESSDPNGVVTTNTYDLRQRLLSTSIGGQSTSYEYDAAGQLLKVTSPDASWIGYEYDAAHRQTAVKDNLGNRIEYMLDNAGNKTGQSVKDPGGNLARTLSRSIDALGRVQQTTGRE